jgi:uncharacterized membrane protein YidH (DUF202 family)
VSSYDADARDPGLAAERTDLAWSRSGLSLVGCGAIVLRGMARTPLSSGDIATGVCILALGAAVWVLGAWHMRRVRARSHRPTSASDLVPVTIGVGLVGVAAFVVAAFFPS